MSDKKYEPLRLSPQEAREQAAEATGFLASVIIVIGDEEFEVPQRGLLDDDQRERMNELEIEAESWQHEDDIVIADRVTKNADGSETTIKGRTEPGPLKVPYRDAEGNLVKPGYPVRVAIALWGEDKYARFKKGGGRASDVTATLARLDKRIEVREQSDPKSS